MLFSSVFYLLTQVVLIRERVGARGEREGEREAMLRCKVSGKQFIKH